MADGLAVIHVDGLGHDILLRAVERGTMPFVRQLLRQGGYEVQPYNCGIPSTTPYAQAGILYGDNTNIPGFRWWDKQAGVKVQFGVDSTFKHVAHRYFQGREGLCKGGACIAACYPGGAEKTFGIAFHDRHAPGPDEAGHIVGRFLIHPRHVGEMGWHLAYTSATATGQYVLDRVRRRRPGVSYMVGDIAEEIFVHNLTSFAVQQAMHDGDPVIYAALYAYDEAAHGFGPEDELAWRMLRHVDKTLRILFETRDKVAGSGGRSYQVVVLSDHGQTPTQPFEGLFGRQLGDLISGWLPNFAVVDLKGKTFGPRDDALDGHVMLAPSGGLLNVYLSDRPGRLSRRDVDEACPGLVDHLAQHPGIHFVLLRDDVIVSADGERRLGDCGDLLGAFGDPALLIQQLRKLNSFETAGDAILFGRWNDGWQVNFETQLGGHGSLGGEQGRPFVLARTDLPDVSGVSDGSDLHRILRGRGMT